MDDIKNDDGWDRYQLLVMSKLEEHGKLIKEVRDDQVEIKTNVVKLQTKASVWGSIAGAIGAFLVSLFMGIFKH